jgi:tetratricopeptide (TPR) repeat protein
MIATSALELGAETRQIAERFRISESQILSWQQEFYDEFSSNPSHPGHYEFMGDFSLRSGNVQDAVSSFQQAVELDAHCFSAWIKLACSFAALPDQKSAVAAYKQALHIRDHNPERITPIAPAYFDREASWIAFMTAGPSLDLRQWAANLVLGLRTAFPGLLRLLLIFAATYLSLALLCIAPLRIRGQVLPPQRLRPFLCSTAFFALIATPLVIARRAIWERLVAWLKRLFDTPGFIRTLASMTALLALGLPLEWIGGYSSPDLLRSLRSLPYSVLVAFAISAVWQRSGLPMTSRNLLLLIGSASFMTLASVGLVIFAVNYTGESELLQTPALLAKSLIWIYALFILAFLNSGGLWMGARWAVARIKHYFPLVSSSARRYYRRILRAYQSISDTLLYQIKVYPLYVPVIKIVVLSLIIALVTARVRSLSVLVAATHRPTTVLYWASTLMGVVGLALALCALVFLYFILWEYLTVPSEIRRLDVTAMILDKEARETESVLKLVTVPALLLSALFLAYVSFFANKSLTGPLPLAGPYSGAYLDLIDEEVWFHTAHVMISGSSDTPIVPGILARFVTLSASLSEWLVIVMLVTALGRYLAAQPASTDMPTHERLANNSLERTQPEREDRTD